MEILKGFQKIGSRAVADKRRIGDELELLEVGVMTLVGFRTFLVTK